MGIMAVQILLAIMSGLVFTFWLVAPYDAEELHLEVLVLGIALALLAYLLKFLYRSSDAGSTGE